VKLTESAAAAGPRPADDNPVLSPVSRSAIRMIAVTACESGVTTEGIRVLFARLAQAGFGLSPVFEAGVLRELAALRARAPRPCHLQPADSEGGAL
jgi:hypothetical protein